MTARARRRGGALLAVGAGAAALVFDPSAEAATSKRVALLALALVALAASLAAPARERRAAPRAHVAALAFVAVSAASLAYGAPGGALDLATWIAGLSLGAVLASLGRATATRAARLAASIAGGGASIAAIAALARGGRGFALHGLQGNPNWLGLLLAVCLPLSIDALRSPPIELFAALHRSAGARRGARVIAAGVVACELVGLALAHSRVAWCATAAGGVAALALELRARRRAGRPTTRVVALAVVVAVTSLGAASALERGAPAISADVSAAASLEGRAWIAARSLDAAAAHAPLGAGLGRFGDAYLDAQGRALAELAPGDAARRFVNATTAHDDLLQAAVESSVVAAIALAALLSLALHGHAAGGWTAGAASAVALVVTAVGDSPLRQPGVVVVFALACAALPRARAARPRSRAPVYVALLACSGWLLASSTRAWLGERAETRADELEPHARLVALQHAARVDPASGEARLALGLAELAAHDAARAREDLRASRELLANAGTDAAIGEASLELGDVADAKRAFTSAVARTPGSARARLGLAEAERRAGRYDDAERDASIAARLLPGDPRPRALLDAIREQRMDR